MKNKSGNIVLVGFMGVGKGRTARALARMKDMYTVDTDDLIETLVKMKIRTIFSEHGEQYFRKLEQRTALWLEENVQKTIVSTGGGFFKVPNIQMLGTIIYLHSPFEDILQAIKEHPRAKKKIKKRPLLQDPEKAKALFAERLPLYRQVASFEVNVAGRSIDEVAAEIGKRM